MNNHGLEKLNSRLLEANIKALDIHTELCSIKDEGKTLGSGCDDYEVYIHLLTYIKGIIIHSYDIPDINDELLSGNHDDTYRSSERNFDTCYILHHIEEHRYDKCFFLGRKHIKEQDLLQITNIKLLTRIEHQFIERIAPTYQGLQRGFNRIIKRIKELYTEQEVILKIYLDSDQEDNMINHNKCISGVNKVEVIKEFEFILKLYELNILSLFPRRHKNCHLWVTFSEIQETELSI